MFEIENFKFIFSGGVIKLIKVQGGSGGHGHGGGGGHGYGGTGHSGGLAIVSF